MITISYLRKVLKIRGINPDNYTDEDLQILIDLKLKEIAVILGVDLIGTNRDDYFRRFDNHDVIVLNFYPVRSVTSIFLDGKSLDSSHYNLNARNGVIYLDRSYFGDFRIKYVSGFTDELLEQYINPLLVDMIAYTLKYTYEDLPVTSKREGDVSVSYDASNSWGAIIDKQISYLKSIFGSRIKLI